MPMWVQETVTHRDVQRLRALTDPVRHSETDTAMPRSVLYDLNSLVPCTTLGYHTFDAYRGIEFTTRTLGTDIDPEIEFPDTDGTKWARFWACGCSYPERTRDLATIRPGSSFPIDSELAAEDRELIRADGLEFDVVIPLRPRGSVSRRLVLWREPGRDFSDRELLLLRTIRPHLVRLHEECLARSAPTPVLTARQSEIVRCLAAGLTNQQIARRLGISVGTVRKHVENVYTALGVTNRVAAAELHDEFATPSATTPVLTARQSEVVRYLAVGLTNQQIARRLDISAGTVRKHLENVYRTLGVSNRVAAVESVLSPLADSATSTT